MQYGGCVKRLDSIANSNEILRRSQHQQRYLKGSPTGLMQRITCRLLLTLSIRNLKIFSGVSGILWFLASGASAVLTCGKG